MLTRSTRTLLGVVAGTVIVLNCFAMVGVALAEPAADPDGVVREGSDAIRSTGQPLDHSPSSSTLSVAYSAATCIVFVAGYGPFDGSDPLEHDLREEIHDEIHRSSGAYLGDLRETCDAPRSTLRYHLDVLERAGLVSSEMLFGKTWWYSGESDAIELHAALTNDAIAEIVDAIARLEPVSVTSIATEVDRSPSTISYHLDRLDDEGVIEQERRSSTVLSRLAPDARSELRTSDDPPDST